MSSMGSFDTWKGTIASTVGAGVTSGLGLMNMRDGTGFTLNGKTFDTDAIGKFNSFAGSMATSGLTYAMTGSATFNLLDVADLGLKATNKDGVRQSVHTGLLEYTTGGDNGGLRLGTGGTNISAGAIASAMAGLREGSKVMSWKYGGKESAGTLSAINYLGYADAGQNADLSKEIWNGKVKTQYADTEGCGEYMQGSGTITLSSKLLGGGKEESAKLATVLAHEGTHYYGSRIEGIAHLQGLTTYNILSGMPGMKGDSSFTSEMENAIKNKDSWQENTGNTDYWKLSHNDDGRLGWSWDNSFDFNIDGMGTISAETMKQYAETIKYMKNGGTVIRSSETGKDGLALGTIAKQLESGDTDYADFIEGTESFADASILGRDLYNGNLSQDKINAMNSALLDAQKSGLLVKNPELALAADNLIGEGSSTAPYFPLAPYSNGTISITGKNGYRLVDIEMNEKLNQNKSNPKYPLYEFSSVYHDGYDACGSGAIVASENGSYSLNYNSALGIYTDLQGESNSYQVAHGSTNSIINYFAQFGSEGTSIGYGSNGYSLNGVSAGTQIATMGSTGIATGPHAHMTVNNSGSIFGNVFNSILNNNSVSNYDSYAQYMTGYNSPTFYNNDMLWSNVYKYSQNSKYLNYSGFYKLHYLDKFYSWSSQ